MAGASSVAAAADVNPALMVKLPLEFKQLGLSVHKRFDKIATAADSGASREQLLASLSTQLSACVACHASYRLDAVAPAAAKRVRIEVTSVGRNITSFTGAIARAAAVIWWL